MLDDQCLLVPLHSCSNVHLTSPPSPIPPRSSPLCNLISCSSTLVSTSDQGLLLLLLLSTDSSFFSNYFIIDEYMK